ncbi:serine/threonine protein kinase [Pyxidicoccus parkwayensis]|uniref:non-specific serine/threonine protein kinase n=1 Tax=Pyxidicoccus parkwayensis TaxID=2813578 RepID=A0ABX7NWL9_9BACT|nr:serine/threonine-protein kinase [Pyxidicoccus parkwaysis]QSQ23336.1 serine/threonine protein kinase [Pyxidicoccus parkwaysis]
MERIQSVTGHREEGRAACVVCEATLEGSRCGHCGAAVAPGGYRVLRVISQSVHGRVYLAVDAEGRRVALKELLFALVPGVEQLDAFEREASVLRSLSHPDIPRFVASFQEGSGVGTRLYLVQEFLEGESLLQRLERQRLDEDEAWTLAAQVLETLQALHQRTPALIHRDVKPANLILRPDGRAALVDFGAARHLARDVTHGSTLVGTFGYMPPEQLGGTVEPSSDLYALGATLVHALSGRMPADLLDEGLALSFEQHVRASAPFRAFLQRLLARKRSERFGSAAEALAALHAARAPAPVPQAPTEAATSQPIPPAREAERTASDEAAAQAQATGQGITEGAPLLSKRRRMVRWALVGVSVAGLLVGALLASGVFAPSPVVVVTDPPDAFAPPSGESIVGEPPAPSSPAPPATRLHRNFRTPWPGSGSR